VGRLGLLFLLFTASIFAQLLYISPAMDLALSVYEPFFISQPQRPGEIGLFRVMNAASTIQIISFEVGPNVTLDQLVLSTKQAAMKERAPAGSKSRTLIVFSGGSPSRLRTESFNLFSSSFFDQAEPMCRVTSHLRKSFTPTWSQRC